MRTLGRQMEEHERDCVCGVESKGKRDKTERMRTNKSKIR